jgi:membrane protease subunit HflC
MSKIYKLLFVAIFTVIVVAAGFTFTVKEGFAAIVSRFGKIVDIGEEAGLHFKLPWPIDKVITYDTRNQYMDSGYNETLTNDKINIILQTYIVWRISDIQKFYTSIGDYGAAQRHLNDLAATAKNSVIGNYTLSALVSTNIEEIKIDEIRQAIEKIAAVSALANYGIAIEALEIKRIALPEANIKSVYNQMIADRQKYVSQYVAEGERDSALIMGEADAKAAEIFAQGKLEASQIEGETEGMVAQIYAEAYNANPRLFVFLKKLIALENSVNADTTVIMRANESPFDVITGSN